MVLFCPFFFKFLCILAVRVLVHGQDQSGFISLDCGLQANSSYTDEKTGLKYISDAAFIETGVTKSIAPEFLGSFNQQLRQVRSFPKGDRNCYKVELVKNTRYLIRATFLYANYDGLNKLPAFDLHIGPNKWVNVQITNPLIYPIKEIIHAPTFNNIYVCLVRTGPWTPFISALEIRPLHNSTYVAQSGSLSLFNRVDVGSLTNQTIRYPDDVYDRMWLPFHFDKGTDISTKENITSGIDYFQLPSTVMNSATVPLNASEQIILNIDTQDNTFQAYVYIHFAEIVRLEPNQSRRFNISLNGKILYGPVTPKHLEATTVYSQSAIPGGKFLFSFYGVGGSTLPPLLNALELYSVVDLLHSETNQVDVNAITKIKSTYGITRNWQGDPCSPQDYKWDGLNCTYSNTASPVITSLDFSSSGLTGEIDPDISNLKWLETLDLSNNSLTGPVPDFLSQLPLKSLNLAGNNLTGTIPADLFNRWQSDLLFLSVSGNPQLCASVSCNSDNKKNITVPVIISVTALFVIIAGSAIILWRLKKRKQQVVGKMEAEAKREPLELQKRQLRYFEIVQITNNFQRILGKGGFGTVYHGHLDDMEVAVKMLSPSSAQGYKEFQTEVKLLLRVHHRNLTSLVGYCDEGNKMALIYEYMANGNLRDNLSDGNGNFLSWEERLRIALEAAQGLEYLHNGCKPPIIHRDVKPTNILLNNKFQAKLADFGLSRICPVEGGSHVSTIVAGTPGYLDPEYYATNWLTEKSDVFSFGVVLLEIITSGPVISKTRDGDTTHLSQWFSSMVEKGDIQSIVDPRLGDDFDINSLWKVVELAMACVSATSAQRPTMNQVVIELSECLATETVKTEGTSSQSYSTVLHTELTPLAR
ncbi:probable LRR receptor-like serine/threonine-protein kinase At1g51860 isoform X2 [Ricinus communis]|uniref:probable LRR receptor-like serine/threonine-protein kinase At1g51860 isoform X2 n=1 Tax=Ricinus communis TaxID=3988 RepID=UPI000D69AA0A|nr:probable LRR receptor-like serine/threonine-protein kinase At1g51860 isoform X2 [Ricinus communis]|eukprot:XP_025012557.1 probable LRR receptor-like serine/threonine-protein kinase At1g51860 isoform X2 [Ricinus communis]